MNPFQKIVAIFSNKEIILKYDNKPDNYVILDDDNDMLDSQRNNFVRCANNKSHPDHIDIGYGLTRICAEKAVDILNGV